MDINNIKDARKNLGKRVYWDTRDSARYYGCELSGVLEEVQGKNLLIDGDWKWRPFLLNLRDVSLGPKEDRKK